MVKASPIRRHLRREMRAEIETSLSAAGYSPRVTLRLAPSVIAKH
jgi:hypothetical protein